MPDTPTAASPLPVLARQLERLGLLDAPAKLIAKQVRGVQSPGTVKDTMSGTWLGHAVHPILTDVVIGSWTSANLLDLIGGRDSEAAAERLIAVGIAAYFPTALTGVTDWADAEPTDAGVRRVGLVHAVSNATALGFYAASLAARRKGSHGRGVALAAVGAGVMTVGGFLGGHLTYAQGVGVDRTAFDPGPTEWTPALPADALRSGATTVVKADLTPVLLHRDGATVLAIHDRCSHRGCSLAEGTVVNRVVTCGCHGSRFSLEDGSVVRGPATSPQPAYETRELRGTIEVRRRTGA